MIRPVFRKLSLQAIRGRDRWLGVAHARLFLPTLGAYLVTFHDLGNPVLAHALTHLTSIAENAGGTIGAPTRFIRLSNESQ